MQDQNTYTIDDIQIIFDAADQEELNSKVFPSEGAAWQWVIDSTSLQPQLIIDYAKRIELSEFQVIEYAREAIDNGASEADMIKALQAEVQKIKEDHKDDYSKITAAYNLQAFTDGIADSVNAPAISTGFTKLNDALDGGFRKGLYLLGGIPSVGKTSLALQIADQIAAQGHDVLYISMEMERYELMGKSISRGTAELATSDVDTFGGIGNAKTVTGIMDGTKHLHYSATEHDLIQAAIEHYGGFASNLYILESDGAFNVLDVRAAVEKHIDTTGRLPVVIIDYIQILTPLNERGTDKSNLDRIVRELKLISRDYKTPVLGISSFNRGNYNKAVSLESFKESGGLEYGCDVLIGLQYADVEKEGFSIEAAKTAEPARKVDLVILKNRNGKTGAKVPFYYYAMFNLFKVREDTPSKYR